MYIVLPGCSSYQDHRGTLANGARSTTPRPVAEAAVTPRQRRRPRRQEDEVVSHSTPSRPHAHTARMRRLNGGHG